MSQKFAAVKGMNDLLPPKTQTWIRLEREARRLFATYGYGEIRTPIAEDSALFVGGVGAGSEIVQKEMYSFEDRAGRSISLRPEGTAPAVRAYIEHGVAQTESLTRWFYMGPMFRYERMKTGRYRQFSQLGAEALGSPDPALDVEIIALAAEFLRRIELQDFQLHLNTLGDPESRPAYAAALRAHFGQFSLPEDAKKTLEHNPLRLLDSKDAALGEAIAQAPAIAEFIEAPAMAHFAQVRRILDRIQLPYVLDSRLVRGLDYYTRTTFEFVHAPAAGESALGTAGTVCGGGRYDLLVKSLGGPEKPAVGFAMGLDRLALLMEQANPAKAPGPLLVLGAIDAAGSEEAVATALALRNAGHRVDFYPLQKIGRQAERAARVGARFFAAIGPDERLRRSLQVKELASGVIAEVALENLGTWLKANQ